MDEVLTTSEAARCLGLSAERVRQLVRAGQLRAVETPLGRLFPRDEVERLAALRRQREAARQEVTR